MMVVVMIMALSSFPLIPLILFLVVVIILHTYPTGISYLSPYEGMVRDTTPNFRTIE